MQLAIGRPLTGLFLSEPGSPVAAHDLWPFDTLNFQRVEIAPRSPALTTYRIDEAVLAAERPVLLLAHAASCATAALWARLSPARYVAKVAGAVLVEPVARRDAAEPSGVLPFSSIVVGASDHCQRQAVEWGSRLIDGPLPIAGTAPTGRFRAAIMRFTAAIVAADVEAGRRLIASLGDQ